MVMLLRKCNKTPIADRRTSVTHSRWLEYHLTWPHTYWVRWSP